MLQPPFTKKSTLGSTLLFVLLLSTQQTPPGSLRGHDELMLCIDWPFTNLLWPWEHVNATRLFLIPAAPCSPGPICIFLCGLSLGVH